MTPIPRTPATLLLLGVALGILGGCGRDPQREVPGHLEPGPSIDVAQQWLGSGGKDDGLTIGAVPFVDWNAPNIPIVQDGVVDVLYFWPAVSKDGESLREGHHVYVKVAEQSFTADVADSHRSLLNDADPASVPAVRPPVSATLGAQDGVAGEAPPDMPFARGGQPQTRLSVVEVDPRSGSTTVLGQQTVPGTLPRTGDQGAYQDSVLRMMENFNAMQQDQARAAAGAPPSTPAPAAGGGTSPLPQGGR